jgi:hypothetical protein
MSRPNLFDMAMANAPSLQARFEKLCGDMLARSEIICAFCQAIEQDARVSVNMTTSKLGLFLEDRTYLNPHEVARKLSAGSSETPDEVLRRLQGPTYYGKRVAFDRYFEDGEQFRYGALNLGGDGAVYYGKFCVVFERGATSAWRCAYVPGNSLELYVAGPETGHRVDDAAVARDAATHAERHRLAALKHGHEVETSASSWPSTLCSATVFVEAIFTDQPKVEHVDEVRVSRAELRRLGGLLLKQAMGSLAAAEQMEALAFIDLRRRLEAEGMMNRMKGV